MSKVFRGIHDIQKNYNWLISDVNAYPNTPGFQELIDNEYVWITGIELTKMIEIEDFQWIWGAFSGFAPGIEKETVLQYDIPCVLDNYSLWENQPMIRHPLADIEILAFDSSYVTIVCKNDAIISDYLASHPFAIDLLKE